MLYGQQAQKHHVEADYHVWGRAGNLSHADIDTAMISAATNKLKQLVDLKGLNLVLAKHVEHYQGDHLPAIKAILLRFQPEFKISNVEHVSIVYDSENDCMLGFTDMRENKNSCVSHKTALKMALTFLQHYASDLIQTTLKTPELITLKPGERMIFDPVLALDNVELNWIDQHTETITKNAEPINITGIKVKFYIPSLELWSWVIIDANGNIQTFERNISWDFKKYQRNTQMWLHSPWLKSLYRTRLPA